MKITKKTEDRIKAALPKFQKVLGIAKASPRARCHQKSILHFTFYTLH